MRDLFERKFERGEQGRFIERYFLGEIPRLQYVEQLGFKQRHFEKRKLEQFEYFREFLIARKAKGEQAFHLIKILQPWDDPTEPGNPRARDLHALVAKKLMGKEIDYSRLHFYTTVNSHLDIFDGTDALFEYYEMGESQKLLAQAGVDLKTTQQAGSHILYFPEQNADKLEEFIVKENLEKSKLNKIPSKSAEFYKIQVKINEIIKKRKNLVIPYIDKWAEQIAGLIKKQLA